VYHQTENIGDNGNQLVSWLNTSNDRLVAVIFKAQWSGSSSILRSYMGKIARELPDMEFIWIDVDDNPRLSSDLGINQIPSVILLRNQEVVDHIDGMISRSKFSARMQKFL